MERYEKTLSELFALADVKINGNHPWDIQVHDSRFHKRILSQASLGLGESYMDGTANRLTNLSSESFARISRRKLPAQKTGGLFGTC